MIRPNLILTAALLMTTLISTGCATRDIDVEFLKENLQKEGVIELPSGLQYKVLEKGTGVHHPLPGTPCKCHYAGTLTDGTTFDSSYDRGEPTTFAPNQVIKGWTEAMQMMVEGELLASYYSIHCCLGASYQ